VRSRRPSAGRLAPECGFTLIELMVTIIVLTIGLLAMAGTSAVISRQIGGGAQMALAANAAQARFERLRSEDCASLSSGSATERGISEAWTVTPKSRSVEVADTVSFTTLRGDRSHGYVTMIPCPDLP